MQNARPSSAVLLVSSRVFKPYVYRTATDRRSASDIAPTLDSKSMALQSPLQPRQLEPPPSCWRILRTQPVAAGLGTWAIPNALDQIALVPATTIMLSDSETEEGIIDALQKHYPIHIILTTYGQITARVLDSEPASQLRAIVKSGTGVDAIDFPALKQRSLPIVNIPDYGAAAVAETALLLMINLSRNYNTISRMVKKTGWCDPDIKNMKGMDLFGKRCGIVGLGHVGSHFAMIALGLGMQVKAYDKYLSAEQVV